MAFHALDVSIDAIRSLRSPLLTIRPYDSSLAQQIRRAASSVSLNLAEGNRRTGKDRRRFFRIAAGSANEVRTALRVAEAWGYVKAREITGALGLLDQTLAMLWKLTHH